MITDKRYTGPQPDEVTAREFGLAVSPRIVRYLGDATLTHEQVALAIEDHMRDVQQEYLMERNPNGDFHPTAVAVVKDGSNVVELRLNGWTFGTVA